jgi:hypothetical protein
MLAGRLSAVIIRERYIAFDRLGLIQLPVGSDNFTGLRGDIAHSRL